MNVIASLTRCAVLLFASSTALAQLDHALPPSEQAAAGQALVEKWRDAAPAENAEYHGVLKIRDHDNQTETVPLTFKIILGESSWQTVYEAGATSKTPAQKLAIIHAPGKPNQYLFASGSKPGEPAGQPMALTNDQATTTPFAGSDFSL